MDGRLRRLVLLAGSLVGVVLILGLGVLVTAVRSCATASRLFIRSDQRVVQDGTAFRLMGVAGEGGRPRGPVGLAPAPDTPTAFVGLSPPRTGVLSRPEGGFVGTYSFRFQPPAGAKRLELSFALPRQSRTAEFVAAPTPAVRTTHPVH